MDKKLIIILTLFTITITTILVLQIFNPKVSTSHQNQQAHSEQAAINQGGPEILQHPLSVEYMRQQSYPGSEIIIEQTLLPVSLQPCYKSKSYQKITLHQN